MAELDYDQMGGERESVSLPDLSKFFNLLGAFISLALIAGLLWWGYQQVVRDVSGVPVVRALEGPMRVAPEDPGGELATHTGLAVNNIPAEGIAAEPADRLVLAPAADSLAEEDKPNAALVVVEAETVPVSDAAPTAADTDATENLVTNADQSQATIAATDTQTEQTTSIEAEIDSLITAALAEANASANNQQLGEPVTPLISADLGGVAKSLIPLARPVTLASLIPTPVASDGVKSMDANAVAVGTRLAQFGAYDSEEIARQEWSKLAARFPEFMVDKTRVIEQAQSGGKLFYRLRALGFEDLADARRFCSTLVANQVNCIPVKQR